MEATELQHLLTLANQKRHGQLWVEAIGLYRQLESVLSGSATVHHNLALCLLGANQAEAALEQVNLALTIQPELWQASVVKVRALTALGRAQEAATVLQALRSRYPEQAEFSLELANITMHHECDARRARELVQPFLATPAHAADATLTDLMASLYDRDESAQVLNERVKQFARTHLDRSTNSEAIPVRSESAKAPSSVLPESAKVASPRKRLRIGLLSPHFNCSPVYFFCSGALRLLAQEFDLYFFSRSQRADWATDQLRALASGWFDVASLSAEPLDAFLRQHALDVLLDLGGWMDPIGLRAISTKPAPRMYKWVGGQSVTTGLRAFDGWLSDAEQTPAWFEAWFTEPLLRLPHGYVTYTPPPYMPAPVPRSAHEHVLGVIANPVKVSLAFLAALSTSLQTRNAHALPLQLRFIDKRYLHPALQGRILSALESAQQKLGTQLSVQFIAPSDHQNYLSAVGQLSEMLDTFPYTGGLTTMEALSLGVACSGQAGMLFCERHTHAHLHYAQLPARPRSNHAALARSLSQLFTHRSVEEVRP